MSKIRRWLLLLLIIFLPLSAWLVSLTGVLWVSLGRDILLLAIIVVSALSGQISKKWRASVVLAIIFFLAIAASYLTKEDSFVQWARGVRYLAEPFALLLTLRLWPADDAERKVVVWSLIAAAAIVLIGAGIDYFLPNVIRYTLHQGIGFLGQIHLAGGDVRLQSTLAGPNALGLFMMMVALLWPVWDRAINRKISLPLLALVLLVLYFTYSRSSYIGLYVGLIFGLIFARSFFRGWKTTLAVVLVLGIVAGGMFAILKPNYLTRSQSNTERLVQYQRIWKERSQIGAFGRGAGVAGLVSEYAFDGTPNYHSENSYLDVYESTGLFGGIAYLLLWLAILIELVRSKTFTSLIVASSVVGLMVAGIFIDHYTGQVAIWITLLMAGSAIYTP